MTLKSFPRGGKKPATKPKTGLTFSKQDAPTKKKKNRGKRSQEGETGEPEKNYLANTADCLNYSSLGEGMIVLGRIHEATDYDMIVSLPGRLSGKIVATDVSKTYTSLLRSVVDSENGNFDDFKPLSSLFNRGEYVVCCVKSVNPGQKWRIALSLEPELINRNLDPSKLVKGSKIAGSITSIEDHGYVIDTGIDNLRSFLGKKDIDDGVDYYLGKQIFCAVMKTKIADGSTTVQLSTKKKHTETTMIDDCRTLDAYLPGTKISLTIQRVLSNGFQATFNNGHIAYVNALYMDKPLDSYNRGNEVHGKLMYILPTVKFAFFTLLSSSDEDESTILQVGDRFDKAKVSYVSSKGIVVTLKNEIRGLIPFRRTDVAFDKISLKFAIGTFHKCRVLSYDVFERIYVCTMERDLLDEKHLATSSLEIGEILDVEVANIEPDTGFVKVTSGRTKGWVPPEHAKDPEDSTRSSLKIGDIVKARVLGPDKRQKGVLLTFKKSLINDELPILGSFDDVKRGGKHHGTIVKITDKGILVCFYGQIKGWIPPKFLDDKYANVKWNFIIGQTIAVKIENIYREKLTLSLYRENNELPETPEFEIGENVEGIVVESSVEGIYLRIAKNNEDNPKTGFLPAGHMSPCGEIGSYMSAHFSIGDKLTALVFSTKPRFVLTRTFVPREEYRDFKNLKIGDSLPCSIHEINDDGLRLLMPLKNYNSYGNVASCNVDNVDSLRIHQILFARVISIDRKNRKIELATTLHDVMNLTSSDNDLMESVDALSLYLDKIRELSEIDYYKSRPLSKVKIGTKIGGTVEKITDHGLILKLDNDVIGTVRPEHYKAKLKIGDRVNGTIIWINYVHELAEITLMPNFVNSINSRQIGLKNINGEAQLRGDIVLVTNWFVLVILKGAGKGTIAALPTRRHINDLEPDLASYGIGKRTRCYVVLGKSETNFLPICLLKSSFEMTKMPIAVSKNLKRKSSLTNDSSKSAKKLKTEVKGTSPEVKKAKTEKKAEMEISKKAKTKKAKAEMEISKKPEIVHVSKPEVEEKTARRKKRKGETNNIESNVQKKKEKLENPEEIIIPEDDFSESDDDDKNSKNSGLPACGFFWDNKPDDTLVKMAESSSDDDDEEDESEDKRNKKKKKKLSAAERREIERQKEREIRQREEALASNEAPNSVDQFDRLCLASPNNSMIWLQYMAFHLQSTEIEKARAVAKRAIKTMNFREVTERLNVWQAWLNLESRFGNSESLDSVFQEAVKNNDSHEIYLHMLTVHTDAGRREELEKIATLTVRKFKQVPRVWVECGAAFLKMGLKDKSRHFMQRALLALPPQDHVNLMVKFATLENTHGDKERAQTLLDQILSSYPKRVDIWSLYVDALVKSGDLDEARKVLEKAVVQTLPARKMRTLFKKYIDFEQKHGTPEGVSYVQQLAVKYVENKCKKDLV